jgi:hypothetical protein
MLPLVVMGHGITPSAPPAFAEEFKAISARVALRTQQDESKVYSPT